MAVPKTFRYLYYRAMRSHGRPREIAMGMAIGLFVGMTPTMSFQMAISIPLAALFGQNKISAGVGVWITNPITAVPIYTATYALGAIVLGRNIIPEGGLAFWFDQIHGFSDLFWALLSDFALPLWVGGVVAGIPLAVTGYILTYQAVVAYRLRVRAKRLKRLHVWRWNAEEGWKRVSNPDRAPEEHP